MNDLEGAIDEEARAGLDADGAIDRRVDAPHRGEQVLGGADRRAALAEIAVGALEHQDVPADAAQQVGGEQSGDRAADHERARHSLLATRHSLTRAFWITALSSPP